MDELPALVVDHGSGTFRAGFASEEAPRTEFPCFVGKPKYVNVFQAFNRKSTYIGEEANTVRGILKLKCPIEQGNIIDWEVMNQIWTEAFYPQLGIDPREHSILLTEPPLNSRYNRERMTQIMFEEFQSPAIFLETTGILSMYASGRTTGVVLDIGETVTQIVPIYEGYSFRHAVYRLNLAGRDITRYLARIMDEKGYRFTTTAEMEIVKDIKEKLAFIAVDFEQQPDQSALQRTYELPDGQVITIGSERFRCSEILFAPWMVGVESKGIHELVMDSISKCDVDLRKHLYANVVISGGTTLLPGMRKRLEQELQILAPNSTAVRLHVPSDKATHLAWIGGSILGSLTNFRDMWIKQQEYDEYGPAIVHHKCRHNFTAS